MPVIACKLPHGLDIRHEGKRLVLLGANIGEDLEQPSRNGSPADNTNRAFGYGLTTITADQAEFFTRWSNAAQFIGGDPAKGKVEDAFPALSNGAIEGPFKDKTEAIREIGAMVGVVVTGFEGLDPEKEKGVEENTDANEGKSARRK